MPGSSFDGQVYGHQSAAANVMDLGISALVITEKMRQKQIRLKTNDFKLASPEELLNFAN